MGFFKVRYVRDYVEANKLKSAFFWILSMVLAGLIAVALVFGFGKTLVVMEGSMEPTLEARDTLLLDRVAYKLGKPQRGDLVAFRLGDEDTATIHIKRVIGLPGETIQIREGQLIIDGETFQEQGAFPLIQNPGMFENEVTLSKTEYFVLGDNRNNSVDSRFVDIGLVEKRHMIGKLWFRLAPKGKFGPLNK